MLQMNAKEQFKNQYEKLVSIPYNYGSVLNSSCCDISNENTIAIGTKKCLLILSLNLDMARPKFDLNLKSNVNETFSINIIETPKMSKSYRDLLSKYFYLNEFIQSNELKKGVKRKISRNSKNHVDSKDKNFEEIENDNQAFLQNSLFDSSLYDLIGSLNPLHQCNQGNSLSNKEEPVNKKHLSGFKYCKWNKNIDYNYLCAVSNENQIMLYEGNFKLNKKLSEKKAINISEQWMISRKYDEQLTKVTCYDNYVDILYDNIPLCVEWSGKIKNQSELLFIAFKSNNIAIFRLNYSNTIDSVTQVEFDSVFSINDCLTSSDSYFDSDKSIRSKTEITSIFFKNLDNDHFLLAVGLFNGNMLLKTFRLNESKRNESLVSCDIKDSFFINLPDASAIKKVEIIKKNSNLLFVFQKEYFILYKFVNFDENYHINTDSNYGISKNLPLYKLVNFENLEHKESSISYLLIYENDYNDILKLTFDFQKQTVTASQSNDLNESLNNNYKIIKQSFVSKNQFLLFQINDLSRSKLLKKKPVDFYVNLFQIRLDDELSKKIIINCTNDIKLKNYSDLIWFFKTNLYFNDQSQFFIKNIYDRLSKSCQDNRKLLKLLRILNTHLVFYYESFKNSNEELNKLQDTSQCESKSVSSANLYRTNYRDLSLSLLKEHLVSLITLSNSIGFEKLKDSEKIILLVESDFALKKCFYGINDMEKQISENMDNYFVQHFHLHKNLSGTSTLQKLVALCKNKVEFNEETNIISYLTCPICLKFICFDKNTDINYIECELGHKIKRCIKSFLPLNLRKHNRCDICDYNWNLYSEKEIPNFLGLFTEKERECLFCD